MVVVDTNVVAFLLIEFSNVLATYVRSGGLSRTRPRQPSRSRWAKRWKSDQE